MKLKKALTEEEEQPIRLLCHEKLLKVYRENTDAPTLFIPLYVYTGHINVGKPCETRKKAAADIGYAVSDPNIKSMLRHIILFRMDCANRRYQALIFSSDTGDKKVKHRWGKPDYIYLY